MSLGESFLTYFLVFRLFFFGRSAGWFWIWRVFLRRAVLLLYPTWKQKKKAFYLFFDFFFVVLARCTIDVYVVYALCVCVVFHRVDIYTFSQKVCGSLCAYMRVCCVCDVCLKCVIFFLLVYFKFFIINSKFPQYNAVHTHTQPNQMLDLIF